jgi:hypothetical protein
MKTSKDVSCRLWDLLIRLAKKQKTISYGDASKLLGIHHRVIRHPLHIIQKYCHDYSLPHLTILVVDRNGKLGKGKTSVSNMDIERNRVYEMNWQSIKHPCQELELPHYLKINKPLIIVKPDQIINLIKKNYFQGQYLEFPVIHEIKNRFPRILSKSIQREDVLKIFAEKKYYLGFITAMLWGGINATRPKEKNKQETIDLYILLKEDQKKIETIIEQVKKYIQKNELEKCFNYLSKDGKIKGIGSAYFTKLMYFIGQSEEKVKIKPLILDKWTSNAYLSLLIDSLQKEKIKSYYTGKINEKDKSVSLRIDKSGLYKSFVEDMNKWAILLNISASKLEEFIFGISLKENKSNNNPRIQLWKIITDYYYKNK